jgi:hypothetical protein
MPAKIIGSPSCTVASNATVESPTVVDYTTASRRAIRVTRRVISRAYFKHLRFADPSWLKKSSDSLLLAEYGDQVYEKLEGLFPVIGCQWTFFNRFCNCPGPY